MRCDDAIELMSERLDGRLTADRAAALESHLASCAACRDTTRALRAAALAVRSLPEVEPRAGLDRRVRARLASPARRPLQGLFLRPAVQVALAASVALVIGVYATRWTIPPPAREPAPAQAPVRPPAPRSAPMAAKPKAPADAPRQVAPAADKATEQPAEGRGDAAPAPVPDKKILREAEGRIWADGRQPPAPQAPLSVGARGRSRNEAVSAPDAAAAAAPMSAVPAPESVAREAAALAEAETEAGAAPGGADAAALPAGGLPRRAKSMSGAGPSPARPSDTETARSAPVAAADDAVLSKAARPAVTRVRLAVADRDAALQAVDRFLRSADGGKGGGDGPQPTARDDRAAAASAAERPRGDLRRADGPDGSLSVTVRIPASSYARLLAELGRLGALTADDAVRGAAADGTVAVEITFQPRGQ